MVRRRSTVRFRKGAPRSETGSDHGTGLFRSWCSSEVQQPGQCSSTQESSHLPSFLSAARVTGEGTSV
jgi:hypothetical protein